MNELMRRIQADIDDGRSRRWIAERAGISDATIRQLLAGHVAKIGIYEKLATNYFKVPVDDVLRWAELLPQDDKITISWSLRRIIDVLSRLPESEQAAILSDVLRKIEQREASENSQ
jgi:transcriptional regulator with XRE-family HTH domain